MLVHGPPARARLTARRSSASTGSSPCPRRRSHTPLSDACRHRLCLSRSGSSASRTDRVVFLDQRKLPLEEVDVDVPLGRRGRRRDQDDGRARRARDRDRRRLRDRARGGARRGPRRRRRGAARLAADGGQPRLGARRDARRPVAPSTRGRSTATRSSAAGAMAAHAAALLAPGTRALTHCNAGGLATGGYGSAVGALLAAWERDLLTHVWVDETRPLLQGARLTAWELETAGIPHAVIADSAAASRMAAGEVDVVFTGADRIAAQRRHREQDRHLRARRAGRAPRDPVLHRRAELDRRPRDAERRARSRSRSATRPRSRRASRRATPPSTSRRRR